MTSRGVLSLSWVNGLSEGSPWFLGPLKILLSCLTVAFDRLRLNSQIVLFRYRTKEILDVDVTTTLYGHLMKAAKRRTEKARQMVDDQRRRILALETERRSLLKAHLAGAVPIDLLQEEQNRISTELANAGALMANAEVHWEYLEKNLDRALAFASNLGDAYAMASPQVRRNLNQSMFEEIAIEVDGSIVHAPM